MNVKNETPVMRVKRELQSLVIDVLQESGCMNTCINCKHFDEPKELCTIAKPPARPPARTIVFGCGSYEEAPE
jgi:hypothetical protein